MASESTNSSSSISSIPITTPSLTLVNFPTSLKLTSTNYLSWKTQIVSLLQGLDLYKFIDGSYPSPAPTVDAAGTSIPHADYPTWYRQDRLLFGALIGTLSAPIVPLVTNATTSLEAWKILSNTFASPSRGHIKQIQHRLKQTTKTPNQSITDFMQSVKVLIDELAILGKKMDQEDITDVVLSGLDQKTYKPVIDAIHARDTPISFHELHEKLINHELSLVQNNPPTPSFHQPVTAFAAHTRPATKTWVNQNRTNQPGILPTPSQPTANRPFLGKCQWCFGKGHSLSSCYVFRRLYPQITPPTYPKSASPNKPQVNMMGVQGYSLGHSVPEMQAPANMGSAQSWTPSLWDTGASHHVTQDLNALSLHSPYDGTDELVIGDGLPLTPPSPSRNN